MEEVEFREKIDKIKPKQQKEQVMQMVTSWMEQGIEQGIEQGEERIALKMVRRVLFRRIGLLEPEVDQRLQSLSVSKLEELLDLALDFNELPELLSWLNQNQSGES